MAITTDQGEVAADAVAVAMGPWSGGITGIPPVFADKGHSLVFATGTDIPDEALFLELRDGRDLLTPEIFPRPDGTTYVSAISRRVRVPNDAADVEADPGAWERLETLCARLSPALRPERIIARQACCRPSTPNGLPLIGRHPGAARRVCCDRPFGLGYPERTRHRGGAELNSSSTARRTPWTWRLSHPRRTSA